MSVQICPVAATCRTASGWSRWILLGLWMVTLGWSLGPTAVRSEEPASAVAPLMKLFQGGRLPAERLPTVVEMICKRGNQHDLQVIFEALLTPDRFSPEVRRQTLAWLTDAAVTRKVKPVQDLQKLEVLIVGPEAPTDAELQQGAIRLAAAWQDAAMAAPLQTIALDGQAAESLRQVAMEALVGMGLPSSRSTLEQLAGETQPLKIRFAAAAGLVSFDLPTAAKAAAHVLVAATPQDNSGPLLDAFLERKEGPDALAAALAEQTLSVDVAKRALRYMYSVGRSDESLSNVLSTAAGIATDTPPPTPEEVAQIVADVSVHGDPVRGEAVFRRQDLNCMKCHSVSRAGGQVGPDLSAVGGSSPVDYIVNSILNPNLAVKEQYVTRVFVLVTGKVLTGVVIDRDDVQVNVRDANGHVQSIPVADIEEEAEGETLMPQGLTKFLTRAELLDLARFVSELGRPGPYAVQTARTIQRWRVLQNPPAELVDEVPHLEHIRQHVLGSDPQAWAPAYGRVAGVLPLDELRGEPAARVLILQGEVTVTTAGEAEVVIESTEPFQSWLDAEAKASAATYRMQLEPGLHKITLRIELSEREKPELRVEFKSPDGSPINFQVVGGS